jgi:hypothetical protein
VRTRNQRWRASIYEISGLDFCPGLEGGIAEQINVKCIVAFLKEDAISPVPALRNVMGVARENDSG